MSIYRVEKIDFSNGIKSEVINNNFDCVQKQIDEERVTSAGYGIAEGMDFVVKDGTFSTYWKDFNLEITRAIIINKDGSNTVVEGKSIPIEKPELMEQNEICIIDNDGYITLSRIPYALNRTTTADNVAIKDSGVSVYYEGSIINVGLIKGNKILVENADKNKGYSVNVKYFTSSKRLDYIYVNNNNEIDILKGTTSFSPTRRVAEDVNFPICTIMIDPFRKEYVNSVLKYCAANIIFQDEREKRAIYVNDNELYIYGEKYIDMQSIKLSKPENPEDFTFWYNPSNNKLMVFREVSSGIKEWTSVNDESLVTVYESYIWTKENKIWDDSDYMTFLLDKEDIEQWPRLCFLPYKNALEIYIDNMPLHSNQFEEIIELNENGVDGEKEEVGIGFRILQKLPRRANVEIRVKHRVKVSFLQTRFQRSATFSATDNIILSSKDIKIYDLNDRFRYGENQIDLYLNGIKLLKNIDFYEDVKTNSTLQRGNICSRVELDSKINFASGDILSYKIITTIYSYDHIDDYFDKMYEKFNDLKTNVESSIKNIDTTLTTYMDVNDNTVQRLLDSVEQNTSNINRCIKNDAKITETNLSDSVVNGLSKGLINAKFTMGASNIINPSDITPAITLGTNDFIVLFNLSNHNSSNVLVYGTDYVVEKNGSSFLIRMLNTTNVIQGNVIYITGINF